MENKKVITGSLIVLFLILAIVYSLTYQKKQSLFKAQNEVRQDAIVMEQDQGSGIETDVSMGSFTQKEARDSVSLGGLHSNEVVNIQEGSIKNADNTVGLTSLGAKMLPGTTEYFGTLDIVSILGQKPKFTLQDSKGNYFAYYGDRLDFEKTIQSLGGSVYEMVTESEIIQNQLFGDKVSYINLSVFKDVWVIMVIEIDGDVWLLQIPADIYHYSKEYLKSLFIN